MVQKNRCPSLASLIVCRDCAQSRIPVATFWFPILRPSPRSDWVSKPMASWESRRVVALCHMDRFGESSRRSPKPISFQRTELAERVSSLFCSFDFDVKLQEGMVKHEAPSWGPPLTRSAQGADTVCTCGAVAGALAGASWPVEFHSRFGTQAHETNPPKRHGCIELRRGFPSTGKPE